MHMFKFHKYIIMKDVNVRNILININFKGYFSGDYYKIINSLI